MIKVENIQVFNFEGAFRGLRNPMNSWDKSDSDFGIALTGGDELIDAACEVAATYETHSDEEFDDVINELLEEGTKRELGASEHYNTYAFIGAKDWALVERMVLAGTDESKFMRQIMVSMDIIAPIFLLKEFDTYKIGTVANSCSTMHKICSEPITHDCFSFDNYSDKPAINAFINSTINACEYLRQQYLETKDKTYWRALIQLLPESWNQRRTVTLNYQVLRAMYFARRHHKLQEWHDFCDVIKSLPYAALITMEK